ncbi:hypothetical protein ADEAN_000524800 [Angomonas deanei]|uniref:Uncharacterized protein n=1 Tax=Angomonas deanei TaxID=59799 RepID=A0A7G2CD61_9TRYP|nr:hypothetical protein ADEAN_000524800 [Angomonas deanei]
MLDFLAPFFADDRVVTIYLFVSTCIGYWLSWLWDKKAAPFLYFQQEQRLLAEIKEEEETARNVSGAYSFVEVSKSQRKVVQLKDKLTRLRMMRSVFEIRLEDIMSPSGTNPAYSVSFEENSGALPFVVSVAPKFLRKPVAYCYWNSNGCIKYFLRVFHLLIVFLVIGNKAAIVRVPTSYPLHVFFVYCGKVRNFLEYVVLGPYTQKRSGIFEMSYSEIQQVGVPLSVVEWSCFCFLSVVYFRRLLR